MVVDLFWARGGWVYCYLFFFFFNLPLYSLTSSILQTHPNFYYHFSVASQNAVYSALYSRHQLKFCGYLEPNLSQWRKEVLWVHLVPSRHLQFFRFYLKPVSLQRYQERASLSIFLKLCLNEILRTWESQQTFSIAFLPCWT